MGLPNHAAWKGAFDAEIKAIYSARTWDLVPLPGRKALGTTWVCKVKTNADGSFNRCTRIQTDRRSRFHFNFRIVTKLSTIRILSTLAVLLGLHIHHVDVDSAFLNGTHEEVYVKQPEGYVIEESAS